MQMRRKNSFNAKPYKVLGNKLKSVREKLRESLAEVSGAVEIDAKTLGLIEEGEKRPSEDLLFLLISHFNIGDNEATNLWELAGYSDRPADSAQSPSIDQDTAQITVLPMDVRIVYTDMANVTANEYGLVMNFLQTTGLGAQPLAVARVGMSKEHAKSVLEMLQKSIEKTEDIDQKLKFLPSPKIKKQKPKKN